MLPRLLHWLDIKVPVAEIAHGAVGAMAFAALAFGFTHMPSAQATFSTAASNTLIMTSDMAAPSEFQSRPVSVAQANIETLDFVEPISFRLSQFSEAAHEMNKERRCLATGIYFEARGETHYGQMAVAKVILNRVGSSYYPNTICGVVYEGAHRRTGCQFSFTCDGISDRPRDKLSWRKALRLADFMIKGHTVAPQIDEKVYHYHADYVDPYWANKGPLKKVTKIGRHIFYRKGGRES